MNRIRKTIDRIVPYLIFYIVLILVHGYTFGANDQMDFMPYARHIQDASLYNHDFYVDCISSRFNERWLLAYTISFVPHLCWPLFFLTLHAVATVVLLHGLIRWTELFIQLRWQQWSCIWITLILLYNRNLGGNELYYNMICASLLAKSIAIWALYYAYKSNMAKTVILTACATYLHPIVGAQVFILSFLFVSNQQKLKFGIITLLLTLPYLYVLFQDLSQTIPVKEFIQIMYLRNAHHFFPGSFGLTNFIILIPLFSLGLYGFYKLDRRVFVVLVAISVGGLAYSIGMFIAPKYMIMSQWFKATIWLKFYSAIGIVFLLTQIKGKWLNKLFPLPMNTMIFIVFTLFVLFKLYRNVSSGDNVYQLPFLKPSFDIQVALNTKAQSEPTDIFLVPPDYTAFKYYSERSSYVDWKAIPHNGLCLMEWSKRIKSVYGLSPDRRTTLNNVYDSANQYLSRLSIEEKTNLKSLGVTYILYRQNGNKEYITEKL